MHYYVVVFKHENDFFRTFDLNIFCEKIFSRFVDKNREEGPEQEVSKQLKSENYIRSIEQYFDFNEEEMRTADGYLKTHLAVPIKKTLEGMTKRDKDTKRNRGGFKEYDPSKVKGIEDVIGGNSRLKGANFRRRAKKRLL